MWSEGSGGFNHRGVGQGWRETGADWTNTLKLPSFDEHLCRASPFVAKFGGKRNATRWPVRHLQNCLTRIGRPSPSTCQLVHDMDMKTMKPFQYPRYVEHVDSNGFPLPREKH